MNTNVIQKLQRATAYKYSGKGTENLEFEEITE